MDELPVVSTGHLFHSYLKVTESWAYQLIAHTPRQQPYIATKHFRECEFYNDSFRYIRFPFVPVDNGTRIGMRGRINALSSKTQRVYPYYFALNGRHLDLLHSHFAMTAWAFRRAARWLRIPHIVSFYGFDYDALPRSDAEWEARYQKLFTDATLFLCEGKHGASILRNRGCPEEKISVQKLGVDIASIDAVARHKKAGELKVLQVATFTEKKGQRYSVEAVIKALRSCPNIRMTFVGADPEGRTEGIREALEDEIRREGCAEQFTFVDRVPFHELHQFMRDFHVLLQPSVHTSSGDCEGGAPVAVLDAQATGMPVVGTLHCDIPSQVVDGETGRLVPERDSDSLADALEWFYSLDSEQYNELAVAARAHVQKNYSIRDNACALRYVYDDVLRSWEA